MNVGVPLTVFVRAVVGYVSPRPCEPLCICVYACTCASRRIMSVAAIVIVRFACCMCAC